MSSEENGHSSHHHHHHHHEKNSSKGFLVRLFATLRHFFRALFRPVRHFFRKLGRLFHPVKDKLHDAEKDMDVSLSIRQRKRKEKRAQRKERRKRKKEAWWARFRERAAPIVNKLGRKRKIRKEKRRIRKKRQQAQLENQMAPVTQKLNHDKKARKEKRRKRKEARWAWFRSHAAPVVNKLSRKRKIRKEKRQARLNKRIPHVVHAPGYLPGLDRVRLLLMLFMCINLVGSQSGFGGLMKTVCGFVPPAFFMLSGYLVLRESEHRSERIGRAIKRSAIVFGIMAVVYFLLNLIFYRLLGVRIVSAFSSKRFWFNFLVMNVWQFDIGGAIWYVQALLYAYIIIYFLDKWKLLKYDWLFAAVLLVITVVTGELSGLIRWNWHGYTYIPGNFLTRALPYILLGSMVSRKKAKLLRMSSVFYGVGIVVGIVLIFAEALLLAAAEVPGYYGHLIGMGVIAFCVCILTVKNEKVRGFERLFGLSRWHINSIYYLCQPVSLLLVTLLSAAGANVMGEGSGYVAVATFLVCLGLAWLSASIGREASRRKDSRTAGEKKSQNAPEEAGK